MLVWIALTGCGGGGGAGGSPPSNVPVAPVPVGTSAPPATPVTGTVMLPASPLANANVIVGPQPVTGPTAPAQLPAGDVAATTDAAGNFTVAVSSPPAAPVSAEPFVIPPDNILGFAPPATGYYIEVFGAGTDGASAGAPMPLHRFVSAVSALTLHVSTASVAEAAALAAANVDRAANNAGPLTFDESAEEAARAHASDESAAGYTCHYDTRNAGPASRYLAAGGIGLTGEGLAFAAGAPPAAFANTEAGFVAEKTQNPPGAHWVNLIDNAHVWAGLAAVASASAPAFANVDYELVTPNAIDSVVGASGYPVTAGCPNGTVINGS